MDETTTPIKPLPTHQPVDRRLADPAVVGRRAAAKEASRKAKEGRETALESIQPFGQVRVVERPKLDLKRADASVPPRVIFNLSEPEPAIRAGATGVPESLEVDLSGSTVSEMALLGVERTIPTYDEVRNSDGSVTRVPLSPDERYKRMVEDTFKRAFAQENSTLASLLSYRVKVVWRITRAMARLKGLMHDDEDMATALLGDRHNIDPWQVPELWAEPTGKDGRKALWPEVIETFRESERLDDDFRVHLWVPKEVADPKKGSHRVGFPGFALLPPPVPPVWRDNQGEISPNYVPRDDPNLSLFISAVSDIADRLSIPEGSIDDPDQGRLGLQGILDAQLIRMCWPTRTQILMWENMVIEETLQLIIDGSLSSAKKTLRERYGLTTEEITGLLKMASVVAQDQTHGDRESSRALTVLRLENYIERAREALDLRAEMQALKQLSIIQGLSDAQHNDPMVEFMNAVRQVNSERKGLDSPAERKKVPNLAS